MPILLKKPEADASFYVKIFASLLIVWVNFWRVPELFSYPRFFAEEGSLYFSYAYSHSWLNNLLTPQHGYYTVYNSIVTSLAKLPSIDNAPLVTIFTAFVVQVAVSLYVIWGGISILDNLAKKIIVALIIPICSFPHVWLTTIGIHFWLPVVTFFILISSDTADRKNSIFRACFLVLSGLTGVISCFMTPLFMLRTYRDKSKEYLKYSIILTCCSLMQIYVFLHEYFTQSVELAHRFKGNSFIPVFIKYIIYQFSIPLFGRGIFQHESVIKINNIISMVSTKLFNHDYFENTIAATPFVLGMIILLTMTTICVKNSKQVEYTLMLLAFIIVSTISTVASERMSGGPRYTFVPTVIMFTVFAASINIRTIKNALCNIGLYLMLLALFFNIREFRAITNMIYNTEYPVWKKEVEVWRMLGEAYPIRILPLETTMYLKNKY